MSKTTTVTGPRHCDMCGDLATVDAKTVFGPWAYLCEFHFDSMGIGLGTGLGQRLTYTKETK